MVDNYYLSLNNTHEFKYHCHQTSIRAFEVIQEKEKFPSRFSLIAILTAEIIIAPFYIAQKLVEIAVNLFLILNAKAEAIKSLQLRNISTLVGLTIVQLLLPFVCLALRIGGTTLGILSPPLSVRAWQLAENGECLSYLFWSVTFTDFNCQYQDKQHFEEIQPTNAIFYLGETQTLLCLTHDENYLEEVEIEINASFSNLLKIIAADDPTYFYKLLYYDQTNFPVGMGKYRPFYCLDHDVKQILSRLKPSLPKLDTDDSADALQAFIDENLDDFIDKIFNELSTKDIHRLFDHIYFNLRNAFLDETDSELNQSWLKPLFTELKDLFSQRFRYGRAHVAQTLNSFHFSTTD
jgi:hypothetical protein